MSPEKKAEAKVTLKKVRRAAPQGLRRLAGAVGPRVEGLPWAASATANLTRNLWSHSIIMCGHFPEGVSVFELEELDEDETRSEWYVRQMLGSADISGPAFLHLMSGNLSHQIEHHLFPDLPSNRYAEIAPRVRELFDPLRPGLQRPPATCGRSASAWHRVVRLSLPNGWLAETNRRNWRSQLKQLVAPPALSPA